MPAAISDTAVNRPQMLIVVLDRFKCLDAKRI